MTACVVGIDLGTGSAKAVAVAPGGRVLARTQRRYRTIYGEAGEAEQDPASWLGACRRVMADLWRSGLVDASDVQAVALSGQIRSLLVVDRDGRPLRPALLWFDPRWDPGGEAVRRSLVGNASVPPNPLSAQTSAAKLLWLRQHEPQTFAAVAGVRSPKDFLTGHLIGQAVSDPSDASGSGLLDVTRRNWAWPLVDALGLDRAWFPALVESGTAVGGLSRDGARLLGVPSGTPLISGGADNACAAIGAGGLGTGAATCSIGTCGVLMVELAQPWAQVPHGIELLCHAAPERWYALGLLLTGGRSLEWTAHLLSPRGGRSGLGRAVGEALALAPDTRRPLFLPFLEGENGSAPGSLAAAAFIGLRARHGRVDLYRAVLDGLVLAMREQLARIVAAGARPGSVRVAGELAASTEWCRLVAGALGLPVERTTLAYCSELGAAAIAAAGCGLHPSIESAGAAMGEPAGAVEPHPGDAEVYDELYGRYREAADRLRGAGTTLGLDS